MKTPKRWNRLLSLLLAFILTVTIVPFLPESTKADWKDDLWSVYSQMTGEDAEDTYEDEQEQQEQQSQSNKQDSKKDKKNDKKNDSKEPESLEDVKVEKNGEYTSKWEVAAYIHEFGKLPSNFITKNKAKKQGWDNKKGNLAKVCPGKSIGGDHFGNYEGQLPEKKGRDYYECDIDYESGYRSEKRIIYSDDGMIFYTEDHYETFDQLWPED